MRCHTSTLYMAIDIVSSVDHYRLLICPHVHNYIAFIHQRSTNEICCTVIYTTPCHLPYTITTHNISTVVLTADHCNLEKKKTIINIWLVHTAPYKSIYKRYNTNTNVGWSSVCRSTYMYIYIYRGSR